MPLFLYSILCFGAFSPSLKSLFSLPWLGISSFFFVGAFPPLYRVSSWSFLFVFLFGFSESFFLPSFHLNLSLGYGHRCLLPELTFWHHWLRDAEIDFAFGIGQWEWSHIWFQVLIMGLTSWRHYDAVIVKPINLLAGGFGPTKFISSWSRFVLYI